MSREVFIPDAVEFLRPFVAAGVFGVTEVNTAATFARSSPAESESVLLAAALAVRAPLLGHVCVDLATVAATIVASVDSLPDAEAIDVGHVAADEVAIDRIAADAGSVDQIAVERDGQGPVGLDLGIAELPWPEPVPWEEEVARSNLVARVGEHRGSGAADAEGAADSHLRPLVLDGGLLYLSRYWYLERYVAADLVHRTNSAAAGEGSRNEESMLAAEAHVRRLFGQVAGATGGSGASSSGARVGANGGDGANGGPDSDQLAAALAGLQRDLVVISGGPGTGKTTTVARFLAGLLSGLHDAGSDLQIALAAPTGKAATRMTESIRGAITALGADLVPEVVNSLQSVEATTIHRLLGSRGEAGFRHGPESRLVHDVVIVDEVSMVSVSLMAHLLSAIKPEAKVVLVGDPYQLASVEAGVVLGDIVGLSGVRADAAEPSVDRSGPTEPVAPAAIRSSVRTLRTVHRQAAGSPILELAGAIRLGRGDDAVSLLRSGLHDLVWVEQVDEFSRSRAPQKFTSVDRLRVESQVVDAAVAAVKAAVDGNVAQALEHIGGTKVLCGLRVGPSGVISWNKLVEDALRERGFIGWNSFYAGRPVMVTENDYLNNVFNGDVGVAVANDDHFQVWFPSADRDRVIEAARLDRIATQWAMTIHKSQGSEFGHVIVSLPPAGSRILTRELLYTAVTRAKSRLTVIASEGAIRDAIERPVTRSTGLGRRLERADVDPESLFARPL
ncbi:MAG: exodeoxyribonuclease V subunit alpha [Microthrixaceae bacterium]